MRLVYHVLLDRHIPHSFQASKAIFASISANTNKNKDTLTTYLEAPPLSTVSDPLIYWDLVLKSAEDPKLADCALARMALDFLSIPGMPRPCNSTLASHS